MRRRDDQGPAIAGRVHDRCDSDGHHGFPGAHLGVDDSGLLVTVQQQGGDGLDDLGLGREGLALESVHHQLAVSVVGAGIDRGVGAIERLQELVAELVDEVGQVDVQGGGGQGGRLGQSVHVHLLQVKNGAGRARSPSGIGVPCRVEW